MTAGGARPTRARNRTTLGYGYIGDPQYIQRADRHLTLVLTEAPTVLHGTFRWGGQVEASRVVTDVVRRINAWTAEQEHRAASSSNFGHKRPGFVSLGSEKEAPARRSR